jgi:signal transduction histidine kinase
MMGYALFALTALHPSVRTLARPLPDLKPRLSTRRLAVLAGLALVGPGLFAYEGPSKLEASVFSAIVIGTGALFLLVIARMAGLVRRLAGSMSELEAGQVARVALTRRTLWVSESERNQLASELHDGPVQQLTALSYRVQSLRGKVEKDGKQAVEGFKAVQQALSSEIVDLRRLMASLRPGALVERGLEATVGDHLATALQGTGIASRLTVTLPCRPEPEVETVVYRVIQEAISDAVEGRANEIQISLGESGGQLHLLITDDGSGLEAADDGPDTLTVSLEGLRERIEIIGGTFNVTSTPGDGTTLEAYVPMGGIT